MTDMKLLLDSDGALTLSPGLPEIDGIDTAELSEFWAPEDEAFSIETAAEAIQNLLTLTRNEGGAQVGIDKEMAIELVEQIYLAATRNVLSGLTVELTTKGVQVDFMASEDLTLVTFPYDGAFPDLEMSGPYYGKLAEAFQALAEKARDMEVDPDQIPEGDDEVKPEWVEA